ncbi:hypothetical protein Vadar_000660 [Vaccinium darrowii]|uniref:Uncharacterized protein n=1 Tax=Vaccinium darrowii TaxID=229202 RepID=A0ACB7Y5M9_9ERIC|nr:hypothetical protein Vadar_000660 [Vaccinium darrowii]
MWNQRGNANGNHRGNANGNVNDNSGDQRRDEAVLVAIDKDKSSQYALKWAIDNLLSKGQTVTLIHVKQRPASIPTPMGSHVAVSDVNDGVAKAFEAQVDNQAKELFLPFCAFCTRKDIKCKEIILEDPDVSKVICDFVKANLIEALVVGACSRNGFVKRFKATDVPTNLSKGAPEFCSVYVISKGKIQSVRSATAPPPNPLPRPLPNQSNPVIPTPVDARPLQTNSARAAERTPFAPRNLTDNMSWSSSHNQDEVEAEMRRLKQVLKQTMEMYSIACKEALTAKQKVLTQERAQADNGPVFKCFLDHTPVAVKVLRPDAAQGRSQFQQEDEVEAEMRRLKQELKQTMEMYSTACKEALTAKQKAMELHRWKIEEQHRLEQAQLAEEAALAMAEKEKAKTKAAIEAEEVAQRIAEPEAQKRMNAEMKALKESEEKKKVLDVLAHSDLRYCKYTIEEIESATENFSDSRKIGGGDGFLKDQEKERNRPVAVEKSDVIEDETFRTIRQRFSNIPVELALQKLVNTDVEDGHSLEEKKDEKAPSKEKQEEEGRFGLEKKSYSDGSSNLEEICLLGKRRNWKD